MKDAKLPKDILYLVRKWLNRPGHHSTAFVYAAIFKGVRGSASWATLRIGDCTRTVDLDLDLAKEKRDNSIEKVRTLRDALSDLLLALEAEVISLEKKEQERRAKRRKAAQR